MNNKLFFIIIIIVILFLFEINNVYSIKHKCIYDQINNINNNNNNNKEEELKRNKIIENKKILYKPWATSTTTSTTTTNSNSTNSNSTTLTLENTKPIQITTYMDSLLSENDPDFSCGSSGDLINGAQYQCKEEDVLTQDKFYYLGGIINQAIDILSKSLQVPKRTGNISVSANACSSTTAGPIPFPYRFTSPGVDTDLVLFLTARPILANGSVLAFGFDCEFDENYRTVVGQLNFNPASISMLPKDYQFQLGVAIHELSHVLGFSRDRFQKKGLMKQFSKSNTTSDGETVLANMIVSPNVKQYVKKFFNCPSIEGAELEDQGGTGTADSHWEKRLFNNEYMTGTASQNPIFSNLTLSLFSDLGFYAVNFKYAQTLVWGNGLGCSFSSKPCNEWSNSKLFCQSLGSRPTCTYDRISKGQCSITSQRNIPSYYNYFGYGTGSVGGDILADYCPSVEGYSNQYCIDSTNNSTNQAMNEMYLEYYGENSRCFDSSLVRDNPSSLSTNARCYSTVCVSNQDLRIKIEKYYYKCPYNTSIQIEPFYGSITCPTSNELCFDKLENDQINWPEFKSISPTIGKFGDQVTITGINFFDQKSSFSSDIIILIGGIQLLNQTFISNTTVIGTIVSDTNTASGGLPKEYSSLTSSSNPVTVIIYNSITLKNGIGYQSFKFIIDDSSNSNIKQWVKDHWYVVLLVGLAVLGFFGAILRCCFCSGGDNGNKHQQKQHKKQQKQQNEHQMRSLNH